MLQKTGVKRAVRKRRQERIEHLRFLRGDVIAEYCRGDFEAALARAIRLLSEHPRDYDALQVLYRSAVQLNNLSALAEHAQELLAIAGGLELSAPINIGFALYKQGWNEEARRVLEEYLADGPRDSSLRKKARRVLCMVREAESLPAVAEKPSPEAPAPLPRQAAEDASLHEPRVRVSFRPPCQPSFLLAPSDPVGVRLRTEVEHARLRRGFDELVCLKAAKGVDRYWYQIETVKRVLKRFRGRVLLADEVGLGKTIEAAMAATEYLLRGLVKRVLILVPASLVAQWREELRCKFGMDFDDAGEHCAEIGYWARAERVVASAALARIPRHFEAVTASEWDLVIVDEAHRLKNRRTKGWALVNSLRPRFLIMLSATPVENDLVELYNIVTLLKPGLLGTEAGFRKRFLGRDGVRDIDGLREVLSNVMVRNTRSLIDARLPRRFAETFIVEPSAGEARGIERAGEFVRRICRDESQRSRMAGQQLLLQAGSSPAALAGGLENLAEKNAALAEEARALAQALSPIGAGEKGRKLVDIIRAKPEEKMVVFVQFTRTLRTLDRLLEECNIPRAVFTGSMTAAEKEDAVLRFREGANVLLSTGSGGEGRNLQFARTVVNFDLPWNPMLIEQRIGRVHRLGQERDVFVFNFALRGSVEERLLDVLDKKINMFEMVVGEIDEILGDLDGEFARTVFELWLAAPDNGFLDRGFDDLAKRLVEARERYRSSRELADRLFGEELAP